MKQISCRIITEQVKKMCMEANFDLGEDVLQSFSAAQKNEEAPIGREIMGLPLKMPGSPGKNPSPCARIRVLLCSF